MLSFDSVIAFCSCNLQQTCLVTCKVASKGIAEGPYALTPIHAARTVRLSTPVRCFGSRSDANSVAVSIIISPQIILLSSLVL